MDSGHGGEIPLLTLAGKLFLFDFGSTADAAVAVSAVVNLTEPDSCGL